LGWNVRFTPSSSEAQTRLCRDEISEHEDQHADLPVSENIPRLEVGMVHGNVSASGAARPRPPVRPAPPAC